MAEQLKNTLSFDLLPGASAVIPHGLQTILSTPLAPDIIFIPSPDLSATSDTVNVTLTNIGDAELTGSVLVESWHTIERAFGDEANKDLPVKPYIVVSADNAVNLLAPLSTVVFRPGDPAGSRNNVYVTWAGAYAALQSVKGLGAVYLEFDDTFVSPCVVPSGVWSMTDVVWTCPTSKIGPATTFVELADGSSIVVNSGNPAINPSMRIVGYGLTINSSRVGPVAPWFGIDLVLDGPDARIFPNPGTLPMFVCDPAAPFHQNFITITGACVLGAIGDASTGLPTPDPVIDVNGGRFTNFGGAGVIIDNAVTGAGTFNAVCANDSYNGDSFSSENWNFPLFTGAVNIFVSQRHRYAVNNTGATTPVDADYNVVAGIDTSTAAVTVNAPSAAPASGETFIVKDVTGHAAAFNITIAAKPGQTIDGAASAVIANNFGSKTFVCDGNPSAPNWMLTAVV